MHTAPLKLFKPQNSKHSSHVKTKFARSSIRRLEEIANILGPAEVTFYSQNDKAKILYGITLPNHDFVVAPNRKLIPSVICHMKIKKSKDLLTAAVTFSGPTYVAIRSAKHFGSSAFQHLHNIKQVTYLPEFGNSFQSDRGEKK